MLTILIVAAWLHAIGRPKLLLRPLVAVVPVCLLMGSFILASRDGIHVTPDIVGAWHNFPSRVFAETFQKNASGTYLYPFVLFYLLLGVVLLRRSEWATARGGIVAATGVCFVLFSGWCLRAASAVRISIPVSRGRYLFWGAS